MRKQIVLILICAATAAAQNATAELVRKGIVQEESEHDPAAAIRSYQAALQRYQQSRPAAATAIFDLAENYRREHKDNEAKALYLRLAQEFPDQVKLSAESRRILSSVYKITPPRTVAYVVPKLVLPVPEPQQNWDRYRQLLEEQIRVADEQIQLARKRFQLGTTTFDEVGNIMERKLQLEKELAAFDMGNRPAK